MLPNRTTCLTWYVCGCHHMETSSTPGYLECSNCGLPELAATWWRCACEGDLRETRGDDDSCAVCGENLADLLQSGQVQRYPGGKRIRMGTGKPREGSDSAAPRTDPPPTRIALATREKKTATQDLA